MNTPFSPAPGANRSMMATSPIVGPCYIRYEMGGCVYDALGFAAPERRHEQVFIRVEPIVLRVQTGPDVWCSRYMANSPDVLDIDSKNKPPPVSISMLRIGEVMNVPSERWEKVLDLLEDIPEHSSTGSVLDDIVYTAIGR